MDLIYVNLVNFYTVVECAEHMECQNLKDGENLSAKQMFRYPCHEVAGIQNRHTHKTKKMIV